MKHTYLVALSSALLLSGIAVVPAHAANFSCSGGGDFTVTGTTVDSSFGCKGTAVIPGNVTIIELSAFETSPLLTSVSFAADSSLTTIRAYAFADTGLTSFMIPSGVTTIGAQAFADSSALTSVTFRGMTAPSVSEDAFTRIGANPKLYLEDGATGFGSVGDTWKGLLIAAGGTIVTPDPEPDPTPAPAPAPAPAPVPAFTPPPPAKPEVTSRSFSLETSVLAKRQKKVLRALIREVGAKGSFEVVAGVIREPGQTKKQAKALALAKARAIKKYLVLRGVKKKDVSLKPKVYKVGQSPDTRVLGSKPHSP